MKLRKWQSNCLEQILFKYSQSHQHFLCLATPGAGKTTMAAEVAYKLLDDKLIDFVLCFSPSVIISNDIQTTLEGRIGKRFDGGLGAIGGSYTYQGMQSLNSEFWALLKLYRVFVIFDEIHHCSGSNSEDANSWGQGIIRHIQGYAEYTLALTGTPWRSDNAPIALSEYMKPDNSIQCDYIYGLSDAIKDNVCRIPKIIVTDNDDITIKESDKDEQKFSSFSQLLENTSCSYQMIVENEVVIRHILTAANSKLTSIRKENPDAGGLVVASTVEHANSTLNILRNEFNVSAVIATYRENEPTTIIKDFKDGLIPWIVSVGMISEGTNIPRLQVCCHLTRIKTELHFRQILGRILRVTNSSNQEANLFMPAESKLIEYAHRVAEDIPEEKLIVSFKSSDEGICINENKNDDEFNTFGKKDENLPQFNVRDNFLTQLIEDKSELKQPSLLTKTYEATLNVFGQFQQEILAVNISPFD